MKKVFYIVLFVLVLGCSSSRDWFPSTSTIGEISNETMAAPMSSCSPMLGWIGGICTLCGMALLVLTGGRMGMRPIIGGILFVLINYALAKYASWIFLPVVLATGAISLAWAGKIVWKIVNDDDIKIKEMF
jgi:hypothetical protein